jgi:hypothetical protein
MLCPIKIIIAGGRDYKIDSAAFIWLDNIIQSYKVDAGVEIVSGGASGADTVAINYAKMYNIPCKIFHADWKTYGRSAGPRRNNEMAKYADVCILFPGGAGTLNMKKTSEKLNLDIWEYNA